MMPHARLNAVVLPVHCVTRAANRSSARPIGFFVRAMLLPRSRELYRTGTGDAPLREAQGRPPLRRRAGSLTLEARYSDRMPVTPEAPQTRSRRREDVPDRFKWNLADIFPDWEAWESGYKQLEGGIDRY